MEDFDEIYNQFKNDISNNVIDMYYDEDDLIMIYDIAGDNGDLYVQLRVLMLGYKLYPYSEELNQRLGFTLANSTKPDSLSAFLKDNRDRKGIIWDILRVRVQAPLAKVDAEEFLEELIQKYQFKEDEEIIQFMDLIEFLGAHEWLSTNYRRIIDRSTYRDTALNECARMMDSVDKNVSIELLEELTHEDPFSADSWLKLAELYNDEGRAEDARMAIDYAKAIRPNHPYTMYLEACMILEKTPDDRKATTLLERSLDLDHTLKVARNRLSEAYIDQNRKDMAILLWEEELRNNPEDLDAREMLVLLNTTDSSRGADILFDGLNLDNVEAEYILSQRVEYLINQDKPELALELLTMYEGYKGVYDTAHQYIKLLYASGDLVGLCSFMEKERPDGCPELRLDPISLVMYAAALLRLGRYVDAAETAREYIVKAKSLTTTTELAIQFAGMKIVLHYIEACALNGSYSQDRDPLAEAMQ